MSKLTGRNKKPRPTQASRSPYMGEARVRVQSTKFKNQGARGQSKGTSKVAGEDYWRSTDGWKKKEFDDSFWDRPLMGKSKDKRQNPKARPQSKSKR